MPRDRIGELPFPGLLTLYSSANPDKLGTHRYEQAPRLLDDERQGIIYTARAGFVDVAHIRITVDTVRYCTDRIRAAMRAHQSTVALPTLEGSVFFVTLNYPPAGLSGAGHDSNAAEDERIANELAIRIGQRVTFQMMTWHETLTWYGYRTIGFIDEQPSAFTWDDSMSHYVGIAITDKVLRETDDKTYDQRVTAALHEELKAIGAVAPAQTDEATHAVDGIWWAHGKPLKRQVDIGLDGDAIHPWLVRGLPFGGNDPMIFRLPTLADVFGHDFRGMYSVKIDPRVHIVETMRIILPGHPQLFDGDHDLPILVEECRREMKQEYAANVDQPWDAVATTRPWNSAARLTLAPAPPRPAR